MTRKHTVLVIGPTPPPFHGVAVGIRDLLDSRTLERFRVVHLDLADRRGIQHVNKPDAYDVLLFCRQWLALIGMLFRVRPTLTYLVISQTTIGFLRDSCFIWPAYASGSRIVLHLNGGYFRDWFFSRSGLMKAYVRAVLGRVTRMIVLAESMKRLFGGLMDEGRLAVVPNGIDWQDCGPHPGEADGVGKCRILHLSTLSHLKGALVLLRAIPLVVRHRPDVEFVFAGPWSHEEDRRWSERFVAQQGIGGFLRFTGEVEGEQKRALYQSAHVFVFPGVQQEGQPLVVLEAMAAGLPVVFTDRGCLRETVIDGECGLEVPVNDPQQLADRILWLLGHPDEMRLMGARGRDRFRSHFTKEQYVSRMIEVLSQVGAGPA